MEILRKSSLLVFLVICFLLLSFTHGGDGQASNAAQNYQRIHLERLRSLKDIRASVLAGRVSESPSPSPAASPTRASRVFKVTDYGADPTGKTDSTEAILGAISDAFKVFDNKVLMAGIADLGGAEIHLEGGTYNISNPLRLPASGGGNVVIKGGSLLASDNFPKDRHLIELWPTSSSKLETSSILSNFSVSQLASSFASSYEYVTIRDLLLDSNFRGGAILVIDSLRTTIDNCYITHFTSDGVMVQGGHETLIKNTFIGQHITAGGDSGEKSFSGTGITLAGNDNIVTDVVIFSAGTGVLLTGQANILTGVHCYNKATGWGGTGIYVKLPGYTQTRILNCYMDYTGIVAEDPNQLQISGSFFLGDAFVKLKSVNGKINGLNIVDNMFSGHGKDVEIVQLDQSSKPFTDISQVVVDRNSVDGMRARSTVARQSVAGNGTSWTVDFSGVLLFPNHIKHVQYSLQSDGLFPNHGLKSVSDNIVEVGTNSPVSATVYVTVDQSS